MAIPNHVIDVCKIGQGSGTCRYITMSSSGWECGKLTPWIRALLDERVESNTIRAKGDNCDGVAQLNEEDAVNA